MGVIFPLSVPGKIVLILIAVVLGIIWAVLMWPKWARKLFRREEETKPPTPPQK